jgi:hypothetical protein
MCLKNLQVVSCLFLLVLISWVDAGNRKNKQMWFLQLNYKDSVISLVNATLVRGVDSRSANENGSIIYTINGLGGNYTSGEITDPRIIHFDYPDSANPEILRGGTEIVQNINFTMRIPYSKDFKNIAFYKKRSGLGKSLSKEMEKGSLLGTIVLPDTGVSK